MRATDRFKYKLEGEQSEPKISITFSLLQSIAQTFFLSFHEQTIFFPQVAEPTIYFPKFAEQSFFFTKNHSPPPRNQMVGPLESNDKNKALTCL